MTNIEHISQYPFCIFSDQLYSYAKAQEILCTLQQSLGLNPNVILFCCWFAKIGQKQFTQKDMRHILATILSWHEQIILPLKKLRKNLPEANDNFQVNKIRDLILATETKANHVEQLILTEAIIKPRYIRSMLQQFTDAYKNINVYCKVMQITINQEDSDIISNLLTLIFPT